MILDGPTTREKFTDVEVTPHNIRCDVLKENITTAVDVIISLVDQGKIKM